MSAEQPSAARALGGPRVPRRVNAPAVVVLTVVWVLLWDEVSLFLVLTGVGLAVLVGLVFPLPPIDLHGRFRPVAGLRLVLLGVGLTVVAGPLYGYAERAATDIVDGSAYVRAVLPEGVR